VLLWAVVGAWVLAGATLGAIHGFIVPRIAEWRPALETLATRALGVPVRIAHIRASSEGWIPSFELQGVSLLDREGREALVLGRVLTAVSVPSLWQLGFEQIHIDSPTLDVRRLSTGEIEVAGIPIIQTIEQTNESSQAMDWFFSQKEFVIRSGKLRWTDDLNQQPTLSLADVDLVVRNARRQHLMRLDATPTDGLSGRISLRADMRSPLLTLHPGRTTDWKGTAYLHWPDARLDRLASPAQLNRWLKLQVTQGQGALRVWGDVEAGQLSHLTADLALTGVHAQFARAPQPLRLDAFSGRVTVDRTDTGWSLGTGPVAFATADGQRWQHGQLRLQASPLDGDRLLPGRLEASGIHLGALHALGAGLPLPDPVHHWLGELQPQGQIDQLQLTWTGNESGWSRFKASGRVGGLALAPEALAASGAAPGSAHPERPGRPGFRGANIGFELDQSGGRATIDMAHGTLSFPGVFEDPTLPMDRLSADLSWRLQGDDVDVTVARMKFANADLQGQASAQWRTSDPARAPSGSRFPGVLHLQGTLSQGRGERVHRYLPLVIAPDARAYVKAAVLSGQAQDVRFKVAGDLWHMPFERPQDGDFQVALRVKGLDLAYVPPGWQVTGLPPWPALRQLDGELVFDRASMHVRVQSGAMAGAPGLRVGPLQARIGHLASDGVVEVNAQAEGPLAGMLAVVNQSPLAELTGQALAQASASGTGTLKLQLAIPLAQTQRTSVKGQLSLAGNDLQISPDTPLLARTRGRVEFDERGFRTVGASTRMAGGELQFSGGTVPQGGGTIEFKGQGQASAEGLRQLPPLGALAPLLRQASGSTAYTAQLSLGPRGPDLAIQSNLQGLALDLPAPLTKPASALWPLSYRERTPTAAGATTSTTALAQQTLTLNHTGGPLLSLALHRTPEGTAQLPAGGVVRGLLQVGSAVRPSEPLPPSGLSVRVGGPELDTDAWGDLLSPMAPPLSPPMSGTATTSGPPSEPFPLPERLWLDVERLVLGGHDFHQVALDGQRQGKRLSGRVQARELSGQLELQLGEGTQPHHLKARLDRLSLASTGEAPQAEPSGVAASGKPPGTPGVWSTHGQSPLPSLDVQVQALTIGERALGQLELQALNRPLGANQHEWRITKLRLVVPEAELSATGNWAPVGVRASGAGNATTSPTTSPTTSTPTAGASAAQGQPPRRTALQFTLAVKDSGALLARLGMPHVFQNGHGQLEGTLGWLGLPYALHTPSLSGQLQLDVASGRFLKAEPGLAKLLGVLSLQSLPRRLALDFSDVFAQGFAFDFVRGNARIDRGIVFTNNLQMKGPTAAVLMEGQADIGLETQDIHAVVVPEINTGTAALIATAINPAIGLGTFLAQTLLRQPLVQASTQEFRVQGHWADPVVTRVGSRSAPGSASPAPTAPPSATPPPTLP
jgi:uncharacterized protein (TIGR02099 family)